MKVLTNGKTRSKAKSGSQSWKGKAGSEKDGMEKETLDSKIDPSGVCGTKVMFNLELCTARSTCIKKVTVSLV